MSANWKCPLFRKFLIFGPIWIRGNSKIHIKVVNGETRETRTFTETMKIFLHNVFESLIYLSAISNPTWLISVSGPVNIKH